MDEPQNRLRLHHSKLRVLKVNQNSLDLVNVILAYHQLYYLYTRQGCRRRRMKREEGLQWFSSRPLLPWVSVSLALSPFHAHSLVNCAGWSWSWSFFIPGFVESGINGAAGLWCTMHAAVVSMQLKSGRGPMSHIHKCMIYIINSVWNVTSGN